MLRVLEARRGQRTSGPLVLHPISASRSTAATLDRHGVHFLTACVAGV